MLHFNPGDMVMKDLNINLNEKTSYKHVYVDDNNHVHLIMPICRGETVGRDNTCQTVSAMKKFLGKDHGVHETKTSAYYILLRYQKDLENDIRLLELVAPGQNSQLICNKKVRLVQVKKHIHSLQQFSAADNTNCLSQPYPSFPPGINEILTRPQQNCHSVLLLPRSPDTLTRAPTHIFTVKRLRQDYSHPTSGLYHELHSSFETSFPDPAFDGKQDFLARLDNEFDRQRLHRWTGEGEQLCTEARYNTLKKIIEDFFRTCGVEVSVTDYTVMRDTYYLVEENSKFDETLDAVVGSITPDIWEQVASPSLFMQQHPTQAPLNWPFSLDEYQRDVLSIKIQFFLSQINLYCFTKGFSTMDFGQVLEQPGNVALCREVARIVGAGIRSGEAFKVENDLIALINRNKTKFGFSAGAPDLREEDSRAICELFRINYTQIKDSPHFDEFMFFTPEVSGDVVQHQVYLGVSFSEYLLANASHGVDDFHRLNAEAFKRLSNRQLPPHNKLDSGQTAIRFETLSTLLGDNRLDELAAILFLETDVPGEKVFDALLEVDILRLQQSPHWNALLQRAEVLTQDPDEFARFLGKTSVEAYTLRVTPAMARKIYSQMIAFGGKEAFDLLEPLKNEDGEFPAKIRCALDYVFRVSQELGENAYTVRANAYDGYTFVGLESQVEMLQQICKNPTMTIYLSKPMAASLYMAVEQRYGKESSQYQEMQDDEHLNNRGDFPDKLIQALDFLEIPYLEGDIGFWGQDGFIFTGNDEAVREIEEIHHLRMNPPEVDLAAVGAGASVGGAIASVFRVAGERNGGSSFGGGADDGFDVGSPFCGGAGASRDGAAAGAGAGAGAGAASAGVVEATTLSSLLSSFTHEIDVLEGQQFRWETDRGACAGAPAAGGGGVRGGREATGGDRAAWAGAPADGGVVGARGGADVVGMFSMMPPGPDEIAARALILRLTSLPLTKVLKGSAALADTMARMVERRGGSAVEKCREIKALVSTKGGMNPFRSHELNTIIKAFNSVENITEQNINEIMRQLNADAKTDGCDHLRRTWF
jgi:hypothetical protein